MVVSCWLAVVSRFMANSSVHDLVTGIAVMACLFPWCLYTSAMLCRPTVRPTGSLRGETDMFQLPQLPAEVLQKER